MCALLVFRSINWAGAGRAPQPAAPCHCGHRAPSPETSQHVEGTLPESAASRDLPAPLPAPLLARVQAVARSGMAPCWVPWLRGCRGPGKADANTNQTELAPSPPGGPHVRLLTVHPSRHRAASGLPARHPRRPSPAHRLHARRDTGRGRSSPLAPQPGAEGPSPTNVQGEGTAAHTHPTCYR